MRECCYRDGAWWPYCTIELEALEEHRAALEALGATLVAFSPQTVIHNLKSVRDYGLGFNLLSDAGNALADRFGIAYRVGERLIKAVYRPRGRRTAPIQRRPLWRMLLSARYVIGTDGRK
ncbi:MAG: redoxin domain-containing protein [Pseudomonas sp.]|uniref:redoxin domain-containing protein n=1 Tax=Pseudomonas sp. TaxID=306 RepID=UPI003D0E51D7